MHRPALSQTIGNEITYLIIIDAMEIRRPKQAQPNQQKFPGSKLLSLISHDIAWMEDIVKLQSNTDEI